MSFARSLPTLSALCLVAACDSSRDDASTQRGEARRVVPASATAVDFAVLLLEPERIAGLPEQALEYSRLHDAPPEFAKAARFHTYLAEPVLALGPELVIADPYQAPETTQRLRQAGVRVVMLPVIDDWAGARAALLELGRELDRNERAMAVAREFDERVEALRREVASAPVWTAVCYSNFGGSGSTAGAGTTIDDVMKLAGLRNLAADQGRRGHVELGFEGLIAFDPDVIVVSAPLKAPPSAQGDLGGASGRVLTSTPALAGLRAVRERRIVELPAWLFATGSCEIVTAAETLRDELDELLAREQGAASTAK